MTRPKPVHGVFAAAGTPRHPDGSLDLPNFQRGLEYLMERRIRGFAVNGATGEFCLTTPAELKLLAALAAKTTAQRGATFLCGIGSAGLHACLENLKIAEGEGAAAALLAMPYFFPYQQADLEAFCRAVAEASRIPVLLYNLPFASRLEPETVIRLMTTCPNIVGIKDSSGSLDILSAMTERKIDAQRIVGSDGVLAPALEKGQCDAVISGVASVAPELLLALWEEGSDPTSDAFDTAAADLREFIDAITPFPVPWGLKLIGEFSGIMPASFSQPMPPERQPQIDKLRAWWSAWPKAAGKVA